MVTHGPRLLALWGATKTKRSMTITTLNEKEWKVLKVLAEVYEPDEWGAYAFKGLAAQTSLEIKEVRRACRSLAKKGLAQYERTLWNEETGPAGAGYRATEEGAALINPCDVCGARAVFDYYLDESEEQTPPFRGAHHVRECEKHYEQSRKNLTIA